MKAYKRMRSNMKKTAAQLTEIEELIDTTTALANTLEELKKYYSDMPPVKSALEDVWYYHGRNLTNVTKAVQELYAKAISSYAINARRASSKKPTAKYIKVNGKLYRKADTKVEFVRETTLPDGVKHRLYKSVGGDEYFIVSYSPRKDETITFRGNADGKITSWDELGGGPGGEDYEYALESSGLVEASAASRSKSK